MSRVLFYDKYVSGHHLEYLRYLVKHSSGQVGEEVFFAVNEFAAIELLPIANDGVHIIRVPQFDASSQLAGTIQEGAWLIKSIKEEAITDLFFLAVDPYQYIIGSRPFLNLGCHIHGILFSPPHRLFPNLQASIKVKISQWFRRSRKVLQLKWALRNKNLKSLFILDDKEGVSQLNEKFNGTFKLLNDPIPKFNNSVRDDSIVNGIGPNETVLLSFGSIIARKNLEKIISAIQFVNADQLTLIVAGKGKSEYVNKLMEVASIYDGNLNVSIRIVNRFVTDSEMESLLHRSNGILMVYNDFYGSSGVLGHAARHETPVLVADQGLVADLTTRYGLGYLVDPEIRSIAKGMEVLLQNGLPNNFSGARYLSMKTEANFTETVFSILSNEKFTE